MLPHSPAPATPLFERLRTGAGRRTLGLGLALLVEALLLLALLSLGVRGPGQEEDRPLTVVTLPSQAASQAAPEPSAPAPQAAEQAQPQPPAPQQPPAEPTEPAPPAPPTPPQPLPPPRVVTPAPSQSRPSPAAPARPAPSPRAVYGPPNRGGASIIRDTERVGTAPNGEPLYAAAWYREPTDRELHAYLSTAQGPGWGLIACRTAPDYRVEDCVPIQEYPVGSQMNRAILAAAWEFRVRPPRIGGRPQIGTWVRIRIESIAGP